MVSEGPPDRCQDWEWMDALLLVVIEVPETSSHNNRELPEVQNKATDPEGSEHKCVYYTCVGPGPLNFSDWVTASLLVVTDRP